MLKDKNKIRKEGRNEGKMRKSEKKMIITIIIIGIVVIGGIFALKNGKEEKTIQNIGQEVAENKKEERGEEYVQKLEDGSKINVSEKLKESKKVEGLEISNIQLREVNGITTLIADVENKSNTPTELKTVKIEVLDKSEKVITDIIGVIDPVSAKGKVQLNAGVTADVANAYDFRISKV